MKLNKQEVELLKQIVNFALSWSDEYSWSVRSYKDFEAETLALYQKILLAVEQE